MIESDVYGRIECHPHDNKWIIEQLDALPAPMRARVGAKYSEVYQSTYEAHKDAIAPENWARREANTRLREFVERFGGAANGRVLAPGE